MEKIREDLARLFDEMLTQVGGFRKKHTTGCLRKASGSFAMYRKRSAVSAKRRRKRSGRR